MLTRNVFVLKSGVSVITFRSIILFMLLLPCWIFGNAQAADAPKTGIYLGSTRAIFEEKNGAAAVRVVNTSETPFLIQSWVDSYQGAGGWENIPELAKNTFVTTPPLFRLDKGENSLRIQRAGGSFPADRESVFLLKVKTIPSAAPPTPGTNYVQFAFVHAIKLFWRPKGLTGDANEAYKSLSFERQGSQIVAINPTPYHITVKKLAVSGHVIKEPDERMIPPLGRQTWPAPDSSGGQVTYEVVNDFGALTPALTVPLK